MQAAIASDETAAAMHARLRERIEAIYNVRRDVARLDEAIVRASVSRLRPVFFAAVTTILGMTPLLGDAFFASMAVTIMGGLAFASVLTLIAAPVLYYLFFPKARERGQESREALDLPGRVPFGSADPPTLEARA